MISLKFWQNSIRRKLLRYWKWRCVSSMKNVIIFFIDRKTFANLINFCWFDKNYYHFTTFIEFNCNTSLHINEFQKKFDINQTLFDNHFLVMKINTITYIIWFQEKWHNIDLFKMTQIYYANKTTNWKSLIFVIVKCNENWLLLSTINSLTFYKLSKSN